VTSEREQYEAKRMKVADAIYREAHADLGFSRGIADASEDYRKKYLRLADRAMAACDIHPPKAPTLRERMLEMLDKLQELVTDRGNAFDSRTEKFDRSFADRKDTEIEAQKQAILRAIDDAVAADAGKGAKNA
jgi:hypothetical protein